MEALFDDDEVDAVVAASRIETAVLLRRVGGAGDSELELVDEPPLA